MLASSGGSGPSTSNSQSAKDALEKKRIQKYWRFKGKVTDENRDLSPVRDADEDFFVMYESKLTYAERRALADDSDDDDTTGNNSNNCLPIVSIVNFLTVFMKLNNSFHYFKVVHPFSLQIQVCRQQETLLMQN